MPFDWWYNDRQQVGLDFDDEAQVSTYDIRQAGSAERDRELLRHLGVSADMAVADIGCGTGILICEAARTCKSALGIDISHAMLSAAKARAEGLGCDNLTFQQAGFLSFDAPEGVFDLITAKNALHHLPDFWKAMAFSRIYATLKPGGRLYIRDVMFSGPPQHLAKAVEGWIDWLAANTGYSREEGASHVRDEYSTFAWAIERMLNDCGFRVVEHTLSGVYGTFIAERAP